MKIRSDFVSNSSSSSFIVIMKYGADKTKEIISELSCHNNAWNAYKIPNDLAKHEFGWEFENTSDFKGKLNFIGIQLAELLVMKMNNTKISPWYQGELNDFDKYFNMLQKVCKEKFNFCVKINPKVFEFRMNDDELHTIQHTLSYDYYIDHQSCVTENQCMEMFSSEDALYDFLRFNESYIRGGNDNS